MIQFQDIESTLNARGVFFSQQEYTFTLMLVIGEKPSVSYAMSFLLDEYKKVKDTEDEKDFFNNCTKLASSLLQQQHIIKLKEEIGIFENSGRYVGKFERFC